MKFPKLKKKLCRLFLLGLVSAELLGAASCARVAEGPDSTSATDGATTLIEAVGRPPEQIDRYGKITYTSGNGLQYNGIALPEEWPPRDVDFSSGEVKTAPYLQSAAEGGYRPEILDITVGRQLFMDDYLIETTNLKRVFHQAVKSQESPVLKPTTVNELTGSWGVGTSSGGVWYDMQDCKYKMWYDVGFNPQLGYAESDDGVHWTRINNESGTNIVLGADLKNGTCSVVIDYDADPSEKYKMLVQSQNNCEEDGALNYQPDHINGGLDQHHYAHTLFVSSDGIHWKQIGETSLGASGDMTTAFYNAFTGKWVVSLREYADFDYQGKSYVGRVRYYYECEKFEDLLTWRSDDAVKWLATDNNDPATGHAGNSAAPQCYNFNAIAYESIMLGSYQIWMGPENNVIETTGNPKITEIMAAYSRDGFHFDRPSRTPLIAASRVDGAWDKGYLFCTVGASSFTTTRSTFITAVSAAGKGMQKGRTTTKASALPPFVGTDLLPWRAPANC